MPVAPTYPGVYIEEIPSGVHTITGVSTSVTAFIGYTARGSVNEPVHIFSFADFERAFGGLAVDSPLSYTVKHFFQNGGSEAYVVRVAQGAAPAMVTMDYAAAKGALDVTTASAGTWGNNLQIDIDYATTNPASLFNLSVTELVDQNGQMVAGPSETFRNLSMNSFDPGFVVDTVNAGSQLITVARSAGLAISGQGKSTSDTLALADLNLLDATHNRIAFVVDGQGPFETAIALPPTAGTLAARLKAVADEIALEIGSKMGGAPVTAAVVGNTIEITSKNTTERSAVHFLNAGLNNAAAILKLGLANGGIEIEAQAAFRPAQTGTIGGAATFAGLPAPGGIMVNVQRGSPAATLTSVELTWPVAPTTLAELVTKLNAALTASKEPLLAGATASVVGGVLRLLPGPGDHNVFFDIAKTATDPTSADTLGLTTGKGAVENVARYAPGSGLAELFQMGITPGNNGTLPMAIDLIGDELAKTGIYALEKVDLFNLLVMPDKASDPSVLVEAIAYCTRRRAFMIIDAPDTVTTFAQAQTWIGGSVAASLRSRNAALYFPRLTEPDPMMNGAVRPFPAAGALAGLYARTDADRGVWKAPAGTAATMVGATGLTVTLTDKENGTLNPLALNCLRVFPVYGIVSWGARTGKGADVQADEYKYIPVRRLALFMEESLYRGTQWAVFEPNDEPLWAQIRLNLGAFMHTLFAQGAFQGKTPREAYFVKCDKETTTQNDIDLGRVNIVVGFAPLKPAEFVIIQIQQIAGAIQV